MKKSSLALLAVLLFLTGCTRLVPIPPMPPQPTATPVPFRLASVASYDGTSAYTGIENYLYETSGRLITHTVKNAAGVETKSFYYSYDTAGRVTGVACNVSGALSVYSVLYYDIYNRIFHVNEYDGAGTPVYSVDYLYDPDGRLLEKDLYHPGISGVAAYFYFVPASRTAYTSLEIRAADKTLLNKITQAYDLLMTMTSRHMYGQSLELLYYIDFDLQETLRKTDLWYYNAAGNLMIHGVYQYENSPANMDENSADMYETVYLDTGKY